MRISMTLPSMVPGNSRDQTIEWCRRIDRGPYASLAIGERISYPNPDQLTTLAFAAACTDRVRLVPTIVVLPMHPEVLIAKKLATIDVLSGGRLTVGLGVGGREEDFVLAGDRPYTARHRRLDEQVAVMRRVWDQEVPDGADAPVGPPPTTPGGPPLLSGSLGPKAIARAARWAEGVMGFSLSPDTEDWDSTFDVVRDAWSAAGRGEAPYLSTTFWYSLEPDGATVLGEYAASYLGVFGDDTASAMAALATASDRARVTVALDRLEAAGCDEVFLVPTTTSLSALDDLEELLSER